MRAAAVLAGVMVAGPAAGRDVFDSFPVPVWTHVERADVVVVGTVTAVEPGTVEVWLPDDGFLRPERVIRMPVLRVRVGERLLGPAVPAELRVAVADAWPPAAVGDRRAFLLARPQAGGVRPAEIRLLPVAGPDDADARDVRLACRTLADPLAGLTAATKADRCLAAAVLVHRWTRADHPAGFVRRPPACRPVRVPDEWVHLALRAVADLPAWDYGPIHTLAHLGLSEERYTHPPRPAGWAWPAGPTFDESPFKLAAALLEWAAEAFGLDAEPLTRAAAGVYETADRPQPPAPPPLTGEEHRLAMGALWHLFGPEAADRFRPAVETARHRQAFEWWLDGAGRRFALHTPGDRLRPPAVGGWHHPPAARPR